MPTIRVERLIAADPTGTALLLAGRPWAGATRVGPPRRLPTAYVTAFRFDPGAEGTVTLTRSWVGERAATSAVLAVTWDEPRHGAGLRARAEEFLASLAATAEERSFAA